MFRRTKSEPAAVVPEAGDPAATGKGRPTPTRKEAEAAARARAKASAGTASTGKGDRSARVEQSRAIRDAIKAGDERYLPARDRGPVRRFIRDFVDARISVAEFTLPLLFASLLLSASGAAAVGGAILNATLLLVVLDFVLLRFKMRREVRRRFPDGSLKGTGFYAAMRVLQLRFLRLPKPQVKIGTKLPEKY